MQARDGNMGKVKTGPSIYNCGHAAIAIENFCYFPQDQISNLFQRMSIASIYSQVDN